MERPDERKALDILQALFPNKYETAELLDKPDIQDPEKGIGVEVTQSLKEGVLHALGERYELFQDEALLLAKLKQEYGAQVIKMQLTLPDGTTKQLGISLANWDSLYNLVEAYDNKLKKLQSGNYTFYTENNLFIFVFWEDESYITGLLKHLSQLSGGPQYNIVYVYSSPFLYMIDCDCKRIEKFEYVDKRE